MKLLKILSVSLAIIFTSALAQAGIDVEKASFKVDPTTKKVDLSRINDKVKVEKAELPIDQLSQDFNSLLSENGQEDRDAISYDAEDALAVDESYEDPTAQ